MRKTTMSRECNIYIDKIPISEKKRAEVFSREISWDIWQVLREAGARGATAKEIAKALDRYKYPISTIYQALDMLETERVIESTTRAKLPWGHPVSGERDRIGRRDRGGRPLKVYTAGVLIVPEALLEEEFYNRLKPLLTKYVVEIKKIWIEILQKILNEFNSEDIKDFLPQDEIHEMCDMSHEGYEFLTAVSLGILQALEEEEEWKEFARKNRIIK